MENILENKWNKQIEQILSTGISLIEFGINNWALTKSQAIKAINQLLEKGIPILGGDVLVEENNKFKITYDNWYCERLKDESESDFVKRSAIEAKNYIDNYNKKNGVKYYFNLIPGNS